MNIFKGQHFQGGSRSLKPKAAKERLAVILGANASGEMTMLVSLLVSLLVLLGLWL